MMTPYHSTNLVIPRENLRQIAGAREQEAEKLFGDGFFAIAMFLGGSALECYLKLAICHTLKLEGLPAIFKTHDLDVLFLYSGFERELRADPILRGSFDRVVDEWGSDGRSTLLYAEPSGFDRLRAEEFRANLNDPEHGVMKWLKSRL